MLRRQARERRAYLHQKALAQKSNIAHLRKLKAHIDKDKELPKELQDPSLRKDLRYDEAQLLLDEVEQMDDEYYNMGMRDPRILITTSRDPSSRLLQFSKVLITVVVVNCRKFGWFFRIQHGLIEVHMSLIILQKYAGQKNSQTS